MTLDKSIESWAQVTVGAVIGGSYAQIGNVLHMALHDIAELAAALREARAETERLQIKVTAMESFLSAADEVIACAEREGAEEERARLTAIRDEALDAAREERDKAINELCRWRSAIQRLTPGGSESMTPAAVEEYAAEKSRRFHDAVMRAAMAEKEARAEVERHQSACEAAWRYIAERGLWLDYKKHERSEQED